MTTLRLIFVDFDGNRLPRISYSCSPTRPALRSWQDRWQATPGPKHCALALEADTLPRLYCSAVNNTTTKTKTVNKLQAGAFYSIIPFNTNDGPRGNKRTSLDNQKGLEPPPLPLTKPICSGIGRQHSCMLGSTNNLFQNTRPAIRMLWLCACENTQKHPHTGKTDGRFWFSPGASHEIRLRRGIARKPGSAVAKAVDVDGASVTAFAGVGRQGRIQREDVPAGESVQDHLALRSHISLRVPIALSKEGQVCRTSRGKAERAICVATT